MSWLKAYLSVMAGAVLGAGGGALLGWLLGTNAPGFYRAWAPNADSPDFDPLEYAIGLGTIQGLGVGIGVTLLLAAIFAWREVRLTRLRDERDLAERSAEALTPGETFN